MKKIVFAFIGLVFISTNAFSQARDEKNFLQGLKGFYVLAEGLDDSFKKVGLTEGQLETDAEQRLRNAGIYVATREESFKPQIGLLYIIVTTFESKQNKGLYPYMIQIEVKQEVSLTRQPSIKCAHGDNSLVKVNVRPF